METMPPTPTRAKGPSPRPSRGRGSVAPMQGEAPRAGVDPHAGLTKADYLDMGIDALLELGRKDADAGRVSFGDWDEL